jgi:hypothetical protein
MRKALHTVHQFLGGKRETCSLYVVTPGALQLAPLNCSLVEFYNVQSKFTDVSGERALFIFRVEAELIGEQKNVIYIGQLQELHLIIIIIIIILLLIYVLKPK